MAKITDQTELQHLSCSLLVHAVYSTPPTQNNRQCGGGYHTIEETVARQWLLSPPKGNPWLVVWWCNIMHWTPHGQTGMNIDWTKKFIESGTPPSSKQTVYNWEILCKMIEYYPIILMTAHNLYTGSFNYLYDMAYIFHSRQFHIQKKYVSFLRGTQKSSRI